MDKYVAPSLSRGEEVSAFGDLDARNIRNAARALKKPGDLVIVEAEHKVLRDHYVKQVLSQLMAVFTNIVVKRCKKDRAWIIAAVNDAFARNKVSGKAAVSNSITELWILELNSSEDFGMLKLAQMLVSQFEEAGICVLVSCSSSITSQSDFVKWSNRAEVPFWHFEVPDSSTIDAFLEREAEMGAINQAKRLVDDLNFIEREGDKENGVTDLYSVKVQQAEVATLAIPSKEQVQTDGVLANVNGGPASFPGENTTQQISARLKAEKPCLKQASNSLVETRYNFSRALKVTTFGCLLLFFLASAVLVISADRFHLDRLQGYVVDYSTNVSAYLFSKNGAEIPVEPISEVATKNSDPATSSEEPTEIISGGSQGVISTLVPAPIPPLDNEENFSSPTLNSAIQASSPLPRRIKKVVRAAGPTTQSARNLDSKTSTGLAVQDDVESIMYFVQIGAFTSKNSAVWWKISNREEFSDAFVVEKSSGLWAVVTGPYDSKELAKSDMEGKRSEVYVVPGWELKIN